MWRALWGAAELRRGAANPHISWAKVVFAGEVGAAFCCCWTRKGSVAGCGGQGPETLLLSEAEFSLVGAASAGWPPDRSAAPALPPIALAFGTGPRRALPALQRHRPQVSEESSRSSFHSIGLGTLPFHKHLSPQFGTAPSLALFCAKLRLEGTTGRPPAHGPCLCWAVPPSVVRRPARLPARPLPPLRPALPHSAAPCSTPSHHAMLCPALLRCPPQGHKVQEYSAGQDGAGQAG